MPEIAEEICLLSSSDDSHSRSFYRLRYPKPARPVVRIDGLTYPVVELSESGMRIVVSPETACPVNSPLTGHVIFSDQSSEVVEGEVLRTEVKDDDFSEAILQLTTGVSLKRMLAEQMRIRKQYPRFIDPSDGLSVEDQ